LFLEFDKISFSYPGVLDLDDISFKVARGEIVGLIGANGAGKTTAILHIIRYLNPKSGKIRMDGVDISKIISRKYPVFIVQLGYPACPCCPVEILIPRLILVMEEPVTTLPEYDPDEQVIRASVSSEGLEGAFVGKPRYEDDIPESWWPAMSADGRFITFQSYADSLYDRDFNQTEDVFVFDRQTGILECISLGYDGETGNSYSFGADISADGRYVVFGSYASNLIPVLTLIQKMFTCMTYT
jgi:energy-coupling factor transporter ATP-binding protein EcfA2